MVVDLQLGTTYPDGDRQWHRPSHPHEPYSQHSHIGATARGWEHLYSVAYGAAGWRRLGADQLMHAVDVVVLVVSSGAQEPTEPDLHTAVPNHLLRYYIFQAHIFRVG